MIIFYLRTSYFVFFCSKYTKIYLYLKKREKIRKNKLIKNYTEGKFSILKTKTNTNQEASKMSFKTLSAHAAHALKLLSLLLLGLDVIVFISLFSLIYFLL